MKKTILVMLLIGVLLLNACGSGGTNTIETSAPTTSSTNQTNTSADLTENEIYDAFLSKLCKKLNNIIADDTHLDGFNTQVGMVGIAEIASLRELDMLDKIGYTITDLNADGVSELLISTVGRTDEDVIKAQRILCAYTVSDNNAVLLFEGDSKNCYYLLSDAIIYNINLNDSSLLSAGIYQLNEGSTELSCVDFYFSGNNTYYQNKTGSTDTSASTLLEGGADAFKNINEGLSSQIKSVELTLLSAFNG